MTLPLIVFSHLRWDSVFQRPQHILSRMAKSRPVYFVEEPVPGDGRPRWEVFDGTPGVKVCRPHTGINEHGCTESQLHVLTLMVRELVQREALTDYVAWFYTPMMLPLLDGLTPRLVIFDVMDELSLFKGAPPELLQREDQLLKMADVVFTGGPSLYKAKKDRAKNVHCFPSSVERDHFHKAATPGECPECEDQKNIPHPRLGFYGVIDERFDIDLLKAVADAKPDWQLIMVGPVVKIDPATLPKNPNIHYLGQRLYKDLPSFLTGWDVCLLPFALNDSTKFISPTKTVEYMAAMKPIVSTPVTDVKEPYQHCVAIADTPESFIAACEKALAMDEDQKKQMAACYDEVLNRTSWDKTAAEMSKLIQEALAKRDAQRDEAVGNASVLVLGGGPTGLSAAYHLGEDAALIEKNAQVGGWCRSICADGFTFDYAGHIMFSKDPYVHELYQKLLGPNVHWQDREAWVYSKNVFTRYPFQGALYGLPPEVIKECIVGAIEARFGPLNEKSDSLVEDTTKPVNGKVAPAKANGAERVCHGHAGRADESRVADQGMNGRDGLGHGDGPQSAEHGRHGRGTQAQPKRNGHDRFSRVCNLNGPSGDVKDCCGDGIAESEVPLVKERRLNGNGHNGNGHNGNGKHNGNGNGHAAEHGQDGRGTQKAEPANFEEFIYKVWGAGIAKHFAIPYNKKIWAVPLNEMETSWLGGRVPLPDLGEMIEGALRPVGKPMGPNARFGYPLWGGFQSLMNGFLPHIKDRLLLNSGVIAIDPKQHTIKTQDGRTLSYEYLVSTMPLPLLVKLCGDAAPRHVREAAQKLRCTHVRCVNIGVGREKLTDKHWIYYPEDTVFHRIFVQGNASPHCNPKGGFGITCEITYSPHKPLPCDGDDLIKQCIDDCIKVGMIKPEDEIWHTSMVDMPGGYVVYDHARPKNVKIIRDWLLEQDIVLAGRYSEWEYFNSDHAFLAGKHAAEHVRSLQRQKQVMEGRALDEEPQEAEETDASKAAIR